MIKDIEVMKGVFVTNIKTKKLCKMDISDFSLDDIEDEDEQEKLFMNHLNKIIKLYNVKTILKIDWEKINGSSGFWFEAIIKYTK
jgi:hypothetical protein